MNISRLALGTALLAGCLSPAGQAGTAFAQGGSRVDNPVFAAPGWVPAQGQTPDQAAAPRTRAPNPATAPVRSAAPQTARAWVQPRRPVGTGAVRAAAETPVVPSGEQPETIPTPTPVEPGRVPNKPVLTQPALTQPMPGRMQPGTMGYEQVPGIPETYGPGYGGYEEGPYGMPNGGCGSCGGCGDCGDCGGEDECTCGMHRLGVAQLLGNMSLIFGVQGFKGPVDAALNGNFGFHEGLNFGGPLGDPWCTGYQIGGQAVQSDFEGSNADGGTTHSREQAFLTVGLFHRAMGRGLQGGVALDYMHDSYYVKTDLKELRTELSWVFAGGSEIGYWGTYGLNKQQFQLAAAPAPRSSSPTTSSPPSIARPSPAAAKGGSGPGPPARAEGSSARTWRSRWAPRWPWKTASPTRPPSTA